MLLLKKRRTLNLFCHVNQHKSASACHNGKISNFELKLDVCNCIENERI